ncbi:hypothetical protein [Palleronia sp. THAF1]|nr:hypothetical protein [Palleronia sp. THAF1]
MTATDQMPNPNKALAKGPSIYGQRTMASARIIWALLANNEEYRPAT